MKNRLITTGFLFSSLLCSALETPNGSHVPDSLVYVLEEWVPSQIASNTDFHTSTYLNAELIADASNLYNCHSYAWNITEEGKIDVDICWLENPSIYWEDSSYVETTEVKAEKIYYYLGDHSAVVSKTHPGKYESKWGPGPLMRHDPEYGPYNNMQYRRYYRRYRGTTYIVNQTINQNTTTGNGCDVYIQNVTVQGYSKLTVDSGGETTINGPFEMTSGSQLEIK